MSEQQGGLQFSSELVVALAFGFDDGSAVVRALYLLFCELVYCVRLNGSLDTNQN